jgi:adipocyte plasma membrane-associated protein
LEIESGNATILLKNLNFANGVQIHPDQQSVLVNECSRARIKRSPKMKIWNFLNFSVYFDGPKKGKSEIFVENLPGFPDNIRLSHNSTSFLVAMSAVRHSQLITFVDKLGPYTWLRFAAIQANNSGKYS